MNFATRIAVSEIPAALSEGHTCNENCRQCEEQYLSCKHSFRFSFEIGLKLEITLNRADDQGDANCATTLNIKVVLFRNNTEALEIYS